MLFLILTAVYNFYLAVSGSKFAAGPYAITKSYAEELNNKLQVFRAATKTRKAIHLTMITTYGVQPNNYAPIVHKDLTMEVLFKSVS